VSNDQKFKDIVLLTECAKIMQTLAETRHAEGSSIRMGKGLLDIAARMKEEIEESIKHRGEAK
jgi:urease accessory protein UreF